MIFRKLYDFKNFRENFFRSRMRFSAFNILFKKKIILFIFNCSFRNFEALRLLFKDFSGKFLVTQGKFSDFNSGNPDFCTNIFST